MYSFAVYNVIAYAMLCYYSWGNNRK